MEKSKISDKPNVMVSVVCEDLNQGMDSVVSLPHCEEYKQSKT